MLRINRSTARAFLLGFLAGAIWLLPTFGPPNMVPLAREEVSPLRLLRFLVPLSVFLLVRPSAWGYLLRGLAVKLPTGVIPRALLGLLAVVCVLGLVPLAAGAAQGDPGFIVSSVLPIVVSMTVLVGIALLDDQALRDWVFGIGCAAALFFLAGVAITRGQPTYYFIRPRVLFYFARPIDTSGAILGTAAFLVLALRPRLRRTPALTRYGLAVSGGLIVLTLLYLAQSRNTLLACLIALICGAVARRTGRGTRTALYVALFAAPLIVYALIYFATPGSAVWTELDSLTSSRFGVYHLVLTESLNRAGGVKLLGSSGVQTSVGTSFGATDSTTLNFLLNYGALSFAAFVLLLLALGLRLARRSGFAWPYAAICALTVYYAVDASGITTSDLAVFVVFGYVVRAALRAGRPRPIAAAAG